MIWLSYKGNDFHVKPLHIGPFEAEQLLKECPMAIIIRKPLIEHFDHQEPHLVMTYKDALTNQFKHITIDDHTRPLEDYDAVLYDYPYYIYYEEPLNHINQYGYHSKYLGKSYYGVSDQSHSGMLGKPHSGMLGKPHSGMLGKSHSGMLGKPHSGMLGKSHSGMLGKPHSGMMKSRSRSRSVCNVCKKRCVSCMNICRRMRTSPKKIYSRNR